MYTSRKGMGTYIGWPICGYSGQLPALPNPGFSGFQRGLGDCGCGCGGKCQTGLGYFDTGWDISGWSYMEWGTVLVIAYMLISTVTTTQRGYRKVRRRIRRMRS